MRQRQLRRFAGRPGALWPGADGSCSMFRVIYAPPAGGVSGFAVRVMPRCALVTPVSAQPSPHTSLPAGRYLQVPTCSSEAPRHNLLAEVRLLQGLEPTDLATY